MLTLIERGPVYAPEPCGVRQVLLADGRVVTVGEVDRDALERLGAEHEVVDARDASWRRRSSAQPRWSRRAGRGTATAASAWRGRKDGGAPGEAA